MKKNNSTRSIKSETYSVVYLNGNKLPRETAVKEIIAVSARDALNHFINIVGMEQMFVTCVVRGTKENISFTL